MLCIEVTEVGGRGGDMRERGPHCYVWVGGEDVMISVWHGVGGWRCLGGSGGRGRARGNGGMGVWRWGEVVGV